MAQFQKFVGPFTGGWATAHVYVFSATFVQHIQQPNATFPHRQLQHLPSRMEIQKNHLSLSSSYTKFAVLFTLAFASKFTFYYSDLANTTTTTTLESDEGYI